MTVYLSNVRLLNQEYMASKRYTLLACIYSGKEKHILWNILYIYIYRDQGIGRRFERKGVKRQ